MLVYDEASGTWIDDGESLPPSVPGSDTTTVPTNDPSASFDPWAIFNSVGTFAQKAAATASGFLNQRDSLTFAKQDRQLGFQKTQAQIDLTKAQISGQNAIDLARINAQTAAATRQFQAMPGIATLFGSPTAPGQTDWLMLALTAAGVYFTWRAVKGH